MRRNALLTSGALVLSTAVLMPMRPSLDKTNVALAYLLVVLAVSARSGRGPGLATSVGAFLCFNFFFLPPYYTLTVADPLNWAVLGAFLVTSLVAAQLLARARNEAAAARARAIEVERLSSLGAETLKAGRADEALQAIAEMIRSTLGARGCEVWTPGDGEPTLVASHGDPQPEAARREAGRPGREQVIRWVAEHGRAAVEVRDGSLRVNEADGPPALPASVRDASLLVLPLRVRARTVGVLSIVPGDDPPLEAGREHFLEALSYYAALGVERRRLSIEAERADALQKADELKNAVLASVSHDLRTPLTTIKALAHEIAADGDDRALTIEEEADRLNRFVGDLLDLSRLNSGSLQVHPVINAAEDLVGAALQRVSGTVGDHELVASLDPTEPLLLGRFDFVHTLRALVNLIENALKFAPPGSRVEVQARRTPDALEFVVADRGPGVPEAEREQIFVPFHQRDGGGARDAAGAGLGLSIARGLAQAQGGGVRYEARTGGGSVFILSVRPADLSELSEAAATL
jgi:two-component system sensor histidine kinase KdpD